MNFGILTSADLPDLNPSDRSLKHVLESNGHNCQIVIWDKSDLLDQEIDAYILRSTWDYYKKLPLFLQKIRACTRPLINSSELITWNSNKKYLIDLQEMGIPIVPTKLISNKDQLQNFETSWPSLVAKPSVSASSFLTVHISRAEWTQHLSHMEKILNHSELILQPFIPEIQTHGEVSMVYFNNNKNIKRSHAVLKKSNSGDFRVQQDFGGSVQTYFPTPVEWEFGELVLSKLKDPWVYARVDFIPTPQGPLLSELEMIEPELFMSFAPKSGQLFYECIIEFLLKMP